MPLSLFHCVCETSNSSTIIFTSHKILHSEQQQNPPPPTPPPPKKNQNLLLFYKCKAHCFSKYYNFTSVKMVLFKDVILKSSMFGKTQHFERLPPPPPPHNHVSRPHTALHEGPPVMEHNIFSTLRVHKLNTVLLKCSRVLHYSQ